MRRFASHLGRWIAIALLGVGANPSNVQAQPSSDERVLAETLFSAGRSLMQEGRTSEACRKFEASQSVAPALGTLLNLALCHEKEGRLATAWVEFKQGLVLALEKGDSEREEFARDHIRQLEPQLPMLSVAPGGHAEGLHIHRGDVEIPEASWNTSLPVDPGVHRLRASSGGRVYWEKDVALEPRQLAVVVIPVQDAPPSAAPAPTPAGLTQSPDHPVAVADPTVAVADRDDVVGPLRTSAWVAGAIGVGLTCVGGYYGIQALRKDAESEDLCPSGRVCTPEGAAVSNDAWYASHRANVAVGGGLVLVGLSAFTLIWTSNHADPAGQTASTSSPEVAVGAAPGMASFHMGWRY